MEIQLSPELEQIVNDKVASGMYANAYEFIREAILRSVEEDWLKRIKLSEAVALGMQQADRGEFSPRSVHDIIEEKTKSK